MKRASALATPCDAESLAAGRARCKAALAACSLAVEADALCDARCVNGRVLVAPTADADPAVAAAPAAGSPRLYGAFLAAFYALLYYCTRGSSSSSRDAPRRRSSRGGRIACIIGADVLGQEWLFARGHETRARLVGWTSIEKTSSEL